MCRLINRCIDITTPPASQITARVSCGVRGPCPAHERLPLPIHSVRVDAAMVCVREGQPRTTSSPSASGAPSWAPPPPQHLVDIAAQTLYFATAGGLAQGLVQYLHERRRAGAPTSPSLYTQRKHAFQNVSSAIIRGLTRTGALAFLYFTTVGHLNSKAARSLQHSPGRPPFLRSLVLSFARSSPRPSTATSTTQKRTSTPCAAASSPEDSSARWASA